MKTFSFKNWIRFCAYFRLAFPLGFLLFFLANHWFWYLLLSLLSLTIVSGCIIGAFLGILYVMGKLKFHCPFCEESCPCVGGDHQRLIIECSQCGAVEGIYAKWPPFTYKIDYLDLVKEKD